MSGKHAKNSFARALQEFHGHHFARAVETLATASRGRIDFTQTEVKQLIVDLLKVFTGIDDEQSQSTGPSLPRDATYHVHLIEVLARSQMNDLLLKYGECCFALKEFDRGVVVLHNLKRRNIPLSQSLMQEVLALGVTHLYATPQLAFSYFLALPADVVREDVSLCDDITSAAERQWIQHARTINDTEEPIRRPALEGILQICAHIGAVQSLLRCHDQLCSLLRDPVALTKNGVQSDVRFGDLHSLAKSSVSCVALAEARDVKDALHLEQARRVAMHAESFHDWQSAMVVLDRIADDATLSNVIAQTLLWREYSFALYGLRLQRQRKVTLDASLHESLIAAMIDLKKRKQNQYFSDLSDIVTHKNRFS